MGEERRQWVEDWQMPSFDTWRKERQLEDWLVANPQVIGPSAVLLGRQVRVHYGVIDLLVFHHCTMVPEAEVIELKARTAKEADVGQVLRYCNCVRNDVEAYILQSYNCRETPGGEPNLYARALDAIRRMNTGVSPVIIAPDISINALAALQYGGGRYRKAGWDADGFYLDDEWEKQDKRDYRPLAASIAREIAEGLKTILI